MGFFSGYGHERMYGVLGGLGRLTAPGSNAASKDARRVVGAFIRGEAARGACKGTKNNRVCDITSDGVELKVGDFTLADRPAPDAEEIKVCIPARGEMTELKSGKRVEAQSSKDVRAAASALLRGFGAGIGVRTDKEGIRRIIGSSHRSGVAVPGECLTVKLSKMQARRAADGIDAVLEARKMFDTRIPTRKQTEKARAAVRKAKKVAALEKARAKAAEKRAEAAAKKAEAAAAKAAPAERELKTGAKGGKYYERNGRRVYVK
jgi:hypothetical protein